MKSTTKRWASLLAAGALTLTMTACGGDDGGDEPTSAPTSVSDTTDDDAGADGESDSQEATDVAAPGGADDAGATEEPAGTASAGGEDVPVADFVAMLKSPGTETLSTYTMSMEMKAGSETMVMEGAVDLSGDQPMMNIDMEMPGAGAVTMIMAEGRLFMSMPGVTEEGKYLEAPPEQLGEAGSALDDVDLTSEYDAWEAGARKVTLVGEEDVDGETMRRYEIVVDPQAAAEASGATVDPAAATSLGEELVYDVWVDEDDLMRRIVMEIEGMVTDIRADGWGEPVDIEVPAESDIMSDPTG